MVLVNKTSLKVCVWFLIKVGERNPFPTFLLPFDVDLMSGTIAAMLSP